MPDAHANVAHQFEDADQQQAVSTLGMWVFIAQEILFFGGLFGVYTVYRILYPEAFVIGSNHLDIKLGAFNTAVLLLSLTLSAANLFSPAVDEGMRFGTAFHELMEKISWLELRRCVHVTDSACNSVCDYSFVCFSSLALDSVGSVGISANIGLSNG